MKKNNDNSTNNGNIILTFPLKVYSLECYGTTTYVKINLIGQLDDEILDFKDILNIKNNLII